MPSRRLEQPIVAVAEDPACVDMVDGRLIENLHVDDGRLRRQAHGRDWSGKSRPLLAEQRATVRWPSALAARSARAAVGARSGGDEGRRLW